GRRRARSVDLFRPRHAFRDVGDDHSDPRHADAERYKKGDEIDLSTSIGESRYRVTGYDIVKPTDTRSLDDTPNAMLNLVTCYPFYYVGNAPKRFIVHAAIAEG